MILPATDSTQWLLPEAVHRLSGLDLVARCVVEGFITGLHKSPFHGFSVEFSEYRPYHPGAPLKQVDWRVWGRTERHFIKTFEEETNLRALLVMDGSGSMGFGSGPVSKQRYAVYLAAALAYLLLRQRDATGLAVFDQALRTLIPPRSLLGHLSTLLAPLDKLESHGPTATASVLNTLAERLHRRSLVCLFSDLMDDPEAVIAALKNFRIRGHEVIVFHVLDPRERLLDFGQDALLVDMETGNTLPVDTRQVAGSYAQRVRDWTRLLRRACLDLRIDYVDMDTATPFDKALTAFLAKRRQLGASR